MTAEPSACSCVLPEGCFGASGFHFERAGPSYCWRRQRLKYISESDERLTLCHCTRKVERGGEVTEPARPECRYQGAAFAYERCPHYWRAAGRRVDHGDTMRLAPKVGRRERLEEELIG